MLQVFVYAMFLAMLAPVAQTPDLALPAVGTASHFQTIVAALRSQAYAGAADAENDLATIYEIFPGPTQDISEAVRLYKKAADQGLAISEYNLGRLYMIGRGVPKDYGQAFAWFRRAAEQGYGPAQHRVGDCYATGSGVPKDMSESLRWFGLVARKGDTMAQFYIALAYKTGTGVKQDAVEAYKWHTVAASGCSVPAVKRAILKSRSEIRPTLTMDQIASAEQQAQQWKPDSLEDRFMNSGYDGPGSPIKPYATPLLNALEPHVFTKD